MQTQPADDIEAVMGRFQAWAGSKKPGIRELSFDEALKSSRYRWPGAERASVGGKPEPESGARPSAQSRKKAAAAVEQEARKTGHRNRAVKGEVEAGPKLTAKSAKSGAKPVFREALEKAVRPAEVFAEPLEAAETGRQLAISIRLAPAERALIKARAAEAGVTASAYIRQCALEVEQLRSQVRDTIVALRRGEPSTIPSVGLVSQPTPGFFLRLFRWFFPRRASTLALRV